MTRSSARRRASPRAKRSAIVEAKERRERRNLALGLSIASIVSLGGLLMIRQRSIAETSHFRISVSVLVVLVLLLSFNLYALYDWFRHR